MNEDKKISVLIVDDSPFIRMAISRLLEGVPGVYVAGHAKNGEEALEQAVKLLPDVITLDVEMPRMNGLETLKAVMASPRPVPCIMVSSLTTEGAEITLAALEEGAIDFITKPSSVSGMDTVALRAELAEKIRAAAKVSPGSLRRRAEKAAMSPLRALGQGKRRTEAVLIGVSTGGPAALQQLLPRFPADFPAAIVVAQHMPAGFTKSMAERLNRGSAIAVKEAEDGDTVSPGKVIVAKSGMHIVFGEKHGKTVAHLVSKPEEPYYPSINVMFESAAGIFGSRAMAVVMTGMGNDGTRGLKELKKQGAFSIAQSAESCVVNGMPKAAGEEGLIDRVAGLEQLADVIIEEL